MMKDETLDKLITERKNKRGGARPGAGRKRKMDEYEIIEKLSPMADAAFKALHEKVLEGDIKAIQIYLNYYIGMPTQRVESKIEGQLNQVSIEVVKPKMTTEEVMAN